MGVAKFTCCQPLAVSEVNVAVASSWPLGDHKLAVCVPVLAALLKKRTPVIKPLVSELNRVPTSMDCASPPSTTPGTADEDHKLNEVEIAIVVKVEVMSEARGLPARSFTPLGPP